MRIRTVVALLPLALVMTACADWLPTESRSEAVVPGAPAMALTASLVAGDGGPLGQLDVTGAARHRCVLDWTGVVACTGDNTYGRAPSSWSAANGRFVSVSAGLEHTCALTAAGAAECVGDGPAGQASRSASAGVFVQMDAGEYHNCAVTSTGTVECWGSGFTISPPSVTASEGSFVQVSGGYDQNCAVTTTGVINCWGSNHLGQAPPVRQAASGTYVQVSAATFHTCALTSEGVIECFGSTEGTFTARSGSEFTSVAARGAGPCGITTSGTVDCGTQTTYSPNYGTFVHLDDATGCAATTAYVLQCGSNPAPAPFGVPNTLPGSDVAFTGAAGAVQVTFGSVASPGGHSEVLAGDGPAIPSGFMGRSDQHRVATTVDWSGGAEVCVAYAAAGVGDESRLALFHSNGGGWTDVTTTQDPAADAVCGETETLGTFVVAEATFEVPDAFELLSAGGNHTCDVVPDGTVRCWGSNDDGAAPATRAPIGGSFIQVSAGVRHTCAVTSLGVVECWGDNRGGWADPVRTATEGGAFTQVTVGSTYTCAVTDTGVIECWGTETGVHTATSGRFVQADFGQHQGCGLTSGGALQCWGINHAGQAPALIPASEGPFVQIGLGDRHTCAVTADGEVRCWGENPDGRAPAAKSAANGSYTQVAGGRAHSCALTTTGIVECWGDDSAGQAPASRSAATGSYVQVSAGSSHTCARTSAGAVECWGDDSSGQSTVPGAPAPNTPAGQDVTAEPSEEVALTFENVTAPGTTTVQVSNEGDPVPDGFQVGSPPRYYDIETTATFSGAIEICLSYAGQTVEDESALRLLHGDGAGNWTDVTSSLDTDADLICGTVTSLSPFVIVEPAPNAAPIADATGSDGVVESTDALPGGTQVHLDGSASTDGDGSIVAWSWSDAEGDVIATDATATVSLTLGTHVLTLTVTDDDGATGSTTHTVEVRDTTAPEIALTLEVDTLWPPNGKMVRVARGITATDAGDAAPAVQVSVTSDQPTEGRGGGNATPDWNIAANPDGTWDVEVRAERNGKDGARTYTITVAATDASGNAAEASAEVVVPHDRRGK